MNVPLDQTGVITSNLNTVMYQTVYTIPDPQENVILWVSIP
jgi:hypothetical protein